MALTVVKYPDPLLRKVARPLGADEIASGALGDRAREMLDLMVREKGVGLAAPQVAWGVRLFVMNPTGKPEDARAFANPVIGWRSKETARFVEGCLSIPEVSGKIERAVRIRLEAVDALTGERVELELAEFPARVCQHEVDHLDGILIVDKMSPAEKVVAEPRLRDLRREYADRGAAAS